MQKVIIDTDLDTDCDDAGALAVVHHLADQGEAEILGVVCSIPIPACATCAQAINGYHGRPDVPVGSLSSAVWERNPSRERYHRHREFVKAEGMLYNESIAEEFSKASPPEDSTHLYRRLLAGAPDGSVAICAIGTLSALAELLRSPPDAVSDLSGRDLVARKVSRLVSMAAASYPTGKDKFNWSMDLPSACEVIRDWPTPLAVQPVGRNVLTGAAYMNAAPQDHPVRRAYRIWLKDEAASRASWDQLTVLYTIRGATDLFTERHPLSLSLNVTSGENQWSPPTDGPERIHLEAAADNATLAQTVERLMIGVQSR